MKRYYNSKPIHESSMTTAAVRVNRCWSRRQEALLLVSVLFLAAVLRMGWPALTEFKADEARLVALALPMAQFETLPLRGISSSVGLPNFPASVWIYALPLMLWRHVFSPLLFTGLVNVLAVAGTWWFVRRVWGPRAAIVAALLFAVCPWAVVYSRKVWAQNLLPPLVSGWAICALLAYVERKPWFLVLHLFLLALAVQVHLAAAALVAPSALFLLYFRRRVRWQPLLVSAVLISVSAIPFLLYLSGREGVIQALQGVLSGSGGRVSLNLEAWRYTLLLSTGSEIHSLAGPEQFQAYLQRLPPMEPVYTIWVALMAAGLAIILRAWLRGGRTAGAEGATAPEASFILLAWLLSPPLFFSLAPVELALHYLLPVLPAPFILAGIAVHAIVRRWQRTRPLLAVALVSTAALQVLAWGTLLNHVATRATPGAFGTPLALQLQAADEARALTEQTAAEEVLIVSTGEDPGEIAFAAVYDVLLWDLPHRFVDAERSVVFPAAPSVVLLDVGLAPENVSLYRAAASAQRDKPLRDGEGELRILALPGKAAPDPDMELEAPPQFANYVQLLGYNAVPAANAAAFVWQLTWQTADNPVGTEYHFFNHLVDDNGLRIAQDDAATYDPRQWRQGDVVVTRFTLDLPSGVRGPFTMRVGMYAFPSLENVPVLDVAGNATSDAVELTIENEDFAGR